jgi:hypothetical protein
MKIKLQLSISPFATLPEKENKEVNLEEEISVCQKYTLIMCRFILRIFAGEEN